MIVFLPTVFIVGSGQCVALRSLAKQRAIASPLGALDDKIELNRRMNATLQAQALFQSWLVNFSPVRAKLDGRQPAGMDVEAATPFLERFEESTLGMTPKGGGAGNLGGIATNPRLGLPPDEISPSTPYIALEHMLRRCIALGDGPIRRCSQRQVGFQPGRHQFLQSPASSDIARCRLFQAH
jgi:type I restriction enzyme S subunit